ncbi:hypothetical protein [Bradyrhizobium sp. I71]|uniref:Abi-alpha family protein n=1 Tax=Bradyrhizobium sp. I71 TaxID=2590772 RepID=UPI001EF7A3FC|nr:hypothetical protein [Bradyrhizobium sp. I71]ULK97698.1 hypothetical protein FJV43_34260 [Bradyrhizobium sp. I71]
MPLSEQILAAAASAVKNSVKKFVGLSAGELSGLIGDQLRFQRWKNAVRILDRAKVFCAKNKIPIKAIPLKFIVPFLDAASLEDTQRTTKLTDLWASLLASAVTHTDAKSQLLIEKLRTLSSDDAKQLGKLVRHLLREKNANINQFRDEGFDPDSWNIDLCEEFRFHFAQSAAQAPFSFSINDKKSTYSITPEPSAFLKRSLRRWPKAREDFFIDHYGWNIFNEEGFYGGASDNSSFGSNCLTSATVDTLVALGLIERQVQVFRVAISKPVKGELRFDIRLGMLTTMGLEFLRATHINEFGPAK